MTSNTETQETPAKDTTPDKEDGSEIELDDMLQSFRMSPKEDKK